MKKYLFRYSHQGYFTTYQPFEVSGSISQEKANELIRSINRSADRTGGTLDDLCEALDKAKFSVKKYYSIYINPNEHEFQDHKYDDRYDPLPDCMYSWDIIQGITGNY